MTIRTPNPMNTQQSMLDLMRSKARYAKTLEQVTSGKRIVDVGDDPSGSALILNFQGSIGRNDTSLAQVDTASSFLQGAETAVSSAIDSLMRLQELGVTGLAATASGRLANAQEVDSIRTNLLGLANTQEQGKYLFAGNKTGTQPFAYQAPPVVPPIVDYAGNGANITLNLTTSATVTTNLPGDALFYGANGKGSDTDLFQAVTDLSEALKNNDTPGIKLAQQHVDTVFASFNAARADLGGRQAGLDALKTGLTDFNTHLTDLQNTYQAVDYSAAAISLTTENTAQQATLAVMGKVNQRSLFDYLA